ncbi:phosphatidylcholine:ceramide cholinephosphotransferase 1 isoform X2 [Hyalella azteca]|uniref:Phosphatidylcholine:ceramide cholinephosphotransferase 1 isoform X2 n=1 Tax=Hyalella azteca TaxID=294128 RepID=A0A979FLD2_HYAAZ|nr:phosphatidylcholine:ceramide cholinephosphotransferase 1 isoform X2 [Hyalella azteca]
MSKEYVILVPKETEDEELSSASDHHDGAHSSSNGATNFFNATATSAVNAVNGLVKIQMPSPHRDEPRFPPEKVKTFVALAFALISALVNTTSLAMVHERVPQNDPPLPDIFLDSIPVQQWGLEVSEIMIICMNYFTVVTIIFHKHRHIVFRRLFVILGFLYLYRSVTIFVTVLPVANPSYYCSPKSNSTTPFLFLERGLRILSGLGMSINGKHTYCGDYIFSGHTMVLVLCYLVTAEYTSRRWWILHWIYAIMSTVAVLMVLIARGHYTIDCIIAYFITTRLWYIYHTMANNPNLKESGPHNHLSRIWWFPIFQYFEGNVGGTVPRQYEWPLPWPRRWGAKLPQRTS